jgi:uncharacterized protein (DUF4213/DUF364 family)
MILERIYDLAFPALRGRQVRDVRVGLELMAAELDNGATGVTYVLRREAGHACMSLPQAGSLEGMPAEKMAEWALDGKNVIKVAMGMAVMNAVADFDALEPLNCPDGADAVFSAEIRPGDTVGIIGHIGPVAARLKGKVRRIIVFERGEGHAAHPESDQPVLLPECDVVFITSSSLINATLETLLPHCAKARDIVMVGSTTPLYPAAFIGSGVTVLAGTRWLPENRDAILATVSQCGGMKQVIRYGQKLSVRVGHPN